MKTPAKLVNLFTIFSLLLDLFVQPVLAQTPHVVTASVTNGPDDYEVNISADKSSASSDEEVTYTITYGATGLAPTETLTLEASWDLATKAGSPSLFEVATYVDGSATNAYGDTTPSIDTTNRTITWEIDNFPGNTTNQTVNFKLKTKETFTSPGTYTWETYAVVKAYNFQVPEDKDDNSVSVQVTYPTPQDIDATDPIENFKVVSSTKSKISLSWENPEDSDFDLVKILRSDDAYPKTSNEGVEIYSGDDEKTTDTNLDPGTTYYYTAFAYDTSENESDSATVKGKTIVEPITNFKATASTEGTTAILTWKNPDNPNYFKTRILRRKDRFSDPADIEDGTIIYDGFSEGVTDTGLTPGGPYYYTGFALDSSEPPLYSNPAYVGINISEVPPAIIEEPTEVLPPLAPKIESVTITDITATSARISWLTSVAIDEAKVNYGTSKVYTEKIGATSVGRQHFVVIGNLSPQTTYHFQIESISRGVSYFSDDYNFTTAKVVTPPKILIETFELSYETLTLEADDVYINTPLNLRVAVSTTSNTIVKAKYAEQVITLAESGGGVFVGHFNTEALPGLYDVLIVATDVHGNTVTETVRSLRVIPPPRVLTGEAPNYKPVENAIVTLHTFDNNLGKFVVWNGTPFKVANPQITGSSGRFRYFAPRGTYHLTVSAYGYEFLKTKDFDIERNTVLKEDLVLKKIPATFIGKLKTKISYALLKARELGQDLISFLKNKENFYSLLSTLLFILLLVSFFVLLYRAGIHPIEWFYFLPYLLLVLLKRIKIIRILPENRLWGKIKDSGNQTIKHALIYLFNDDGTRHLATTFSDAHGLYEFSLSPGRYRILVRKPNFDPTEKIDVEKLPLKEERADVVLHPHHHIVHHPLLAKLGDLARSFIFDLGDFLIFSGLLLSILYLSLIGVRGGFFFTSGFGILTSFWLYLQSH